MKVLEERLKQRFGRTVRFSSKIGLDVHEKAVTLRILHPDSNMQTDENAFEAWAWALRLLDFEEVHLSWDSDHISDQKHYNRFLYRVEKFRELFPWLITEDFDSSHIFGEDVEKFINHGATPAGVEINPESESAYEAALCDSEAFRLSQGIEVGKLARQLPVGVFTTNPPSERGALFTGSKSAIDLFGVDQNGTLKIFELKAEGNKKVGALSEIFFYWCVLSDVRNGRIRPSMDGPMRNSSLVWADIINSSRVESYIISSGDLHPIVREICADGVLGPFPLTCIERYKCV